MLHSGTPEKEEIKVQFVRFRNIYWFLFCSDFVKVSKIFPTILSQYQYRGIWSKSNVIFEAQY